MSQGESGKERDYAFYDGKPGWVPKHLFLGPIRSIKARESESAVIAPRYLRSISIRGCQHMLCSQDHLTLYTALNDREKSLPGRRVSFQELIGLFSWSNLTTRIASAEEKSFYMAWTIVRYHRGTVSMHGRGNQITKERYLAWISH